MGRYTKIPLQRIIDNYVGRILNLGVLLTKGSKKKSFLKNPGKIVIFRLSAIGDSVLLLPAIKNFKKKTRAEIVMVCSKENLPIFTGQKFIDKIIILDNKSINPVRIIRAIGLIKKEMADISIDTTHSSNLSAFFSHFGGKMHIGFANLSTKTRNKAYDKTILLNQKKHMMLNYFDLFSLTGVKYEEDKIRLVKPGYSDVEKEKIHSFIKNKKNLVGIHTVSQLPYKRWPLSNAIKLIEFVESRGYIPVLISSPDEKHMAKKILDRLNEKSKRKIIDTSGETNITELAALLSRLSLFVALDGGSMHLATSVGVPTLGIFNKAPEDPIRGLFGSNDKLRYYPLGEKSRMVYKDRIEDVDASQVIKELKKMM